MFVTHINPFARYSVGLAVPVSGGRVATSMFAWEGILAHADRNVRPRRCHGGGIFGVSLLGYRCLAFSLLSQVGRETSPSATALADAGRSGHHELQSC